MNAVRDANATMKHQDIDEVVDRLQQAYVDFRDPLVTEMTRTHRNPYQVLIATLLSLRTRDEQTRDAAKRLFALAPNPHHMVKLTAETIEKAIYPVGFYRVKAQRVLEVSQILLDRWGGDVPPDLDLLLELPGVGRKTANLVMTRGYDLPGICVDTHVHRISNRLGYVKTRTPDETEMVLRKKLPQKHWIIYNDLLVAFGQNLCGPISPWCSKCPIPQFCQRNGVKRSR
jgi:endonuclease III